MSLEKFHRKAGQLAQTSEAHGRIHSGIYDRSIPNHQKTEDKSIINIGYKFDPFLFIKFQYLVPYLFFEKRNKSSHSRIFEHHTCAKG